MHPPADPTDALFRALPLHGGEKTDVIHTSGSNLGEGVSNCYLATFYSEVICKLFPQIFKYHEVFVL